MALHWKESSGIEVFAVSLSLAVRLRGRTGRGASGHLIIYKCTHADDNKMRYILKIFKLCDEMLQFKLYKIQWKACHPVDF